MAWSSSRAATWTVALALAATGCARCGPCAPPRAPTALAVVPAPAPAVVTTPAVATPAPRATAIAEPAAAGPSTYDALLRKYVEGDLLRYGAWKADAADMARFDAFLRWQAEADAKAMSREDRIAFYINAYNACCIKSILDHYPVHTPKDVDGFFDKVKYRVAGEELTVSELEYERLIAAHKDMRAHFAVVCSDRGCFPLRSGAWTGATLDEDLEATARRFVKDPRHFKADPKTKEVQISKIFEWYGKKFTEDPIRPAAKPELYLLPYLDGEAKSLLESGDYTVKIIEWDWTINEKAK